MNKRRRSRGRWIKKKIATKLLSSMFLTVCKLENWLLTLATHNPIHSCIGSVHTEIQYVHDILDVCVCVCVKIIILYSVALKFECNKKKKLLVCGQLIFLLSQNCTIIFKENIWRKARESHVRVESIILVLCLQHFRVFTETLNVGMTP